MKARLKWIVFIVLALQSFAPFAFSQSSKYNTPCESGSILNGYKVGIWNYYDEPGELSLSIDYSNVKLTYIKPDTTDFFVYEGGDWVKRKLDVPARLIGSYATYNDQIRRKIEYPVKARNLKIEGRAYLVFEVDVDGVAKNPIVVPPLGGGIAESILSAFNSTPSLWTVGISEGKYVRCRFKIPFGFCLDDCALEEVDINAKYLITANSNQLRRPNSLFIPYRNSLPYNFPKWSPDGSKVLFKKLDDDLRRLYIVNNDGSNLKSVPYDVEANNFTWGENSNTILFDCNYLVYPPLLMRYTERDNTFTYVERQAAFYPLVSSNRSSVAFTTYDESDNKKIKIMKLDGSPESRVLPSTSPKLLPVAWTPDDSGLLFQENDEDQNYLKLYSLKKKTTTLLPILKAFFCGWSPDGSKALIERRDFQNQLFIVDITDGTYQMIPHKLAGNYSISWLREPDKFSYLIETNLFIVTNDGKDRKKILQNVSMPDWDVTGTKLVYIDSKDFKIKIYELNTSKTRVLLD